MKRFFAAVLVVSLGSLVALAQEGGTRVRKTTDQEISGQKTFSNGLTIGDGGAAPTPIRLSKVVSTALFIGDVDGGTARTFTATLTGAAVNDPVACTFPSNLPSDVSAMCWVTAANTVSFKVRNHNTLNVMELDGGASSIYGARLLK
jgi:hypothetical protein